MLKRLAEFAMLCEVKQVHRSFLVLMRVLQEDTAGLHLLVN